MDGEVVTVTKITRRVGWSTTVCTFDRQGYAFDAPVNIAARDRAA